ncbi:uncharacterized protein IL334_001013 [Kwoniella shivajii]|uniref:RING-type domain-containing protein n=1 Tax=Kwoniella shivajii TaxID=564305 RepID=A0ABZ1CSB7_9TREE|nr:hypothetical protein IL334_001013 [Kwoniella shivajii]
MSSPPPNTNNSEPPLPNEETRPPVDETVGERSTSATQPNPLPPIFSFAIGMPGLSHGSSGQPRPPPDGGEANQQVNGVIRPNEAPSFLWTFTIRPEPDGPAPGSSISNGAPAENGAPNPPTVNGVNAQSNESGRHPAPPWIFPPFFNFFMPMRSEPEPNPEKAAELLRSLPTVGKRLLMRVDRIVAAQEIDVLPDEKGWKCGVCLEGLERDDIQIDTVENNEVPGNTEENVTGVKALPCNHLFHEKCLEPWFATKHTCPSCRLDLDPLQTLSSPPSQRTQMRPGPSGLGRRSPHPYARDRPPQMERLIHVDQDAAREAAGNSTFDVDSANVGSTQTDERNDQNQEQDHGPTITFIWAGSPPSGLNFPGMPSRRIEPSSNPESFVNTADPTVATEQSQQLPAEPIPDEGNNLAPPAPSTPGSVFDVPTLFSSPLPMTNRATSASPAPDSTTQPPAVQAEPSTSTILGPALTPSNGGNPLPAETISEDRPRPERRPHITIIRTSSPSPAPGAAGGSTGPGALGLGLGNFPIPPFMFGPPPQLLNPDRNPLTTLFPQSPAATNQFPAENAVPQQPTRPPTPFVPQTLESWTEEREKSLGWRCDAPECIYAPPVDEPEDVDMVDIDHFQDEEDSDGREMLSIHSPLQPMFSPDQRNMTNNSSDEEKNDKFVLMTCQHKWHRACLELSERSCGRLLKNQDEDGRVWVKCEKCRKDGWVDARRPDEGAPSEKEVERLIAV